MLLPRRRYLCHVLPVLVMAGAVAVWMQPLIARISVAVPGAGPGDNLSFAWNLWWMRHSLHDPLLSFWHCPLLLYPVGADLVLHTHTALQAAVYAIWMPAMSAVQGQNVWLLIHLFLNLACTYAVAWRVTRNRSAALLGASSFGLSPYVSAHLLGHFNLVAAWVLPLIALLADVAFTRRRTVAGPLVLGLALGGAVYVDYYYTVYGLALVVVCACAGCVSFERDSSPWSRRPTTACRVLLALLALDLACACWILFSGGGEYTIGQITLHMHSVRNPVSVAGLIVLAMGLWWWAPWQIRPSVDRPAAIEATRAFLIAITAAVVIAAPVLLNVLQLAACGRYVSQPYFWRSAPAGVDVGTLFLGNPFSALFGRLVQPAYTQLHIDQVEQVAWLGPSVLLLAFFGIRKGPPSTVKRWTWTLGFFLLWALGPRLQAFGEDTPVLLPATAIRYLPIVANARIPARAFSVVALSLAVLAALGFDYLRRKGVRTQRIAALVLACLLAADYWPAAPPLCSTVTSGVYAAVRMLGRAGAVCEFPLGVRDGFGEKGTFNTRALLGQMVHERAIVGGFAARVPPATFDYYERTPPFRALLLASAPGMREPADQMPAVPVLARELADAGVRVLVVDKERVSPALLPRLASSPALRRLAEDRSLIAYEVE